MVAEELGRMVIHLDTAPFVQGFKALQFSVVEAGIQAQWFSLRKQMQIRYNLESQALSKAIGRAEWLAMGGN